MKFNLFESFKISIYTRNNYCILNNSLYVCREFGEQNFLLLQQKILKQLWRD